MIEQIKEAIKRSRTCLPYGMMVILIFTKFHVNLKVEDFKKLIHLDYYNE